MRWGRTSVLLLLLAMWAVLLGSCAEETDTAGELRSSEQSIGGVPPHYDFANEYEAGYCADFTDLTVTGDIERATLDTWRLTFTPERPRPLWSDATGGNHYMFNPSTVGSAPANNQVPDRNSYRVTGYDTDGNPTWVHGSSRIPDYQFISNNFNLLESLTMLLSIFTKAADVVNKLDEEGIGDAFLDFAAGSTCSAFGDTIGHCICNQTSSGAACTNPQTYINQLQTTLSNVPTLIENAFRDILYDALDRIFNGTPPSELGFRPLILYAMALLDVSAPGGLPFAVPGVDLGTDPSALAGWQTQFPDQSAPASIAVPDPLDEQLKAAFLAWRAGMTAQATTVKDSAEAWATTAFPSCTSGIGNKWTDVNNASTALVTTIGGLDTTVITAYDDIRGSINDGITAAVTLWNEGIPLIGDAWRILRNFFQSVSIDNVMQTDWSALKADLQVIMDKFDPTAPGNLMVHVTALQTAATDIQTAITDLIAAAEELADQANAVKNALEALVEEVEACVESANGVPASITFDFAGCAIENSGPSGLIPEWATFTGELTTLCSYFDLSTSSPNGLVAALWGVFDREVRRIKHLFDAAVATATDVITPSLGTNFVQTVGNSVLTTLVGDLFECHRRDTRCACVEGCATQGGVFAWVPVDFTEDPAAAAGSTALFALQHSGFLDWLAANIASFLDSALGPALSDIASALTDIADTIDRIIRFFGTAFRYIDQFTDGYHLGAYSDVRPDLHMCVAWAGHGPMARFGNLGSDNFRIGARYTSHNLSRQNRVQVRTGGFSVSARGHDLTILPTAELNMQVNGFRMWNTRRPFGLNLGAAPGLEYVAKSDIFQLADPNSSTARGGQFIGAMQAGLGAAIVRDLYPVQPAHSGTGLTPTPVNPAAGVWPRLPQGSTNDPRSWEIPAWEGESAAVMTLGMNWSFQIGPKEWRLPSIPLFAIGPVMVWLEPWFKFTAGIGWEHATNAFLTRVLGNINANLPAGLPNMGLSYPEDFTRDMHAFTAPDVSSDNRSYVFATPEVGADISVGINFKVLKFALSLSVGLGVTLEPGGTGGILDANAALASVLQNSNPPEEASCSPVIGNATTTFCTDTRWVACSTNAQCPDGTACRAVPAAEGGDSQGRVCMPTCNSQSPCPWGACTPDENELPDANGSGYCVPTPLQVGSAGSFSCVAEPGGSCGVRFFHPESMSGPQLFCVDEWTGITKEMCDLVMEYAGFVANDREALEEIIAQLDNLPIIGGLVSRLRQLLERDDLRIELSATWSNLPCNDRTDGFGDTPWSTGWVSEDGNSPCERHGYCRLSKGGDTIVVVHDTTEEICLNPRTVDIFPPGTAGNEREFTPYACITRPVVNESNVIGWTGSGCHPLQHGFPSACGCSSDAGCMPNETCLIGVNESTGQPNLMGTCVNSGSQAPFSCIATAAGTCPNGRVMSNGACAVPCTSSSQCQDGKVCSAGACVPPHGISYAEGAIWGMQNVSAPMHTINTYAMADFKSVVIFGLGLKLTVKVPFIRRPIRIFDIRKYWDLFSSWKGWYQPGLEARYQHECAPNAAGAVPGGDDTHLYDLAFSPMTNYQRGAVTGTFDLASEAQLEFEGLAEENGTPGATPRCFGQGVCRYPTSMPTFPPTNPSNVTTGNTGRSVGEFLDWCKETYPESQETGIQSADPNDLLTSIIDSMTWAHDFTMEIWNETQLCVGDIPLEEYLGSLFAENLDGEPGIALAMCEYTGQYQSRCPGGNCTFPCGEMFEFIMHVWGCADYNPAYWLHAMFDNLQSTPQRRSQLASTAFASTFPGGEGFPVAPSVPSALLIPSPYDPSITIFDLNVLFLGGASLAEEFTIDDMIGTIRDLDYRIQSPLQPGMPPQTGLSHNPPVSAHNIGRIWYEDFVQCLDGRSVEPLEFGCSCTTHADCGEIEEGAYCDPTENVCWRNSPYVQGPGCTDGNAETPCVVTCRATGEPPVNGICPDSFRRLECSPIRLVIPGEVEICDPEGGGTDPGDDVGGGSDAGGSDAGGSDAGGSDAGGSDAGGGGDAGGSDAGGNDAGGSDAGVPPGGGACCTDRAGFAPCTNVARREDCAALGGTFQPGVPCNQTQACGDVPVYGACCLPSGFCRNDVTEEMCRRERGTFNPGLRCDECICEPERTDAGGVPSADVSNGPSNGGGGGCSATPGSTPSWPVWMMLGAALAFARRRRASRSSRTTASAMLPLVAAVSLTAVACVDEPVDDPQTQLATSQQASDDERVACCLGDRCADLTRLECIASGGVADPSGDCASGRACTTGACCYGRACEDGVSLQVCNREGGTWAPGRTCDEPSTCGTGSSGSCCLPTGACVETSGRECESVGGGFFENTKCTDPDVTCEPPLETGLCCLPDGTCVDTVDLECDGAGGSFFGGERCAVSAGLCRDPGPVEGACCLNNGTCVDTVDRECAGAGGSFQAGTTCADAPVSCGDPEPPTGACCLRTGECSVTILSTCQQAGGLFAEGLTCGDIFCAAPPVTGACCGADGRCRVTEAPVCERERGTFSEGRTCDEVVCIAEPLDGACCLEDGTCRVTDAAGCERENGSFTEGRSCDEVICAAAPVTGACCLTDGSCSVVDELTCERSSGAFAVGRTCDEVSCIAPPATGACCLADGSCSVVDEATCARSMGAFSEGRTCDEVRCTPEPARGACCFLDGSCTETDEITCEREGGSFSGGLTCAEVRCAVLPPIGACCRPDGSCSETDELTCEREGGSFNGGVTCAEVRCAIPPSRGGCCLDDGSCVDTTEADCFRRGGSFSQDVPCGTLVCEDVPPREGACCRNGDCDLRTEDACRTLGGTYFEGLTCAEIAWRCPRPLPTGACCVDGDCTVVGERTCIRRGGVWFIAEACEDLGDRCPDPAETGACCTAFGCAPNLEEAACRRIDGIWYPGAACDTAATCPTEVETGACCTDAGCIDGLSSLRCEALGGVFASGTDCSPAFCPDEDEPTGACCEEGIYLSVATGRGLGCVITTAGTVRCFGPIAAGMNPPSGTFQEIVSGGWYACARSGFGAVSCWTIGGQTAVVPSAPITSMSGGGNNACGITTTGGITCWDPATGLLEPPPNAIGPWQAVAAGDTAVCGLRVDGSVECWGPWVTDTTPLVNGPYDEVIIVGAHACGLDGSGSVECALFMGQSWCTPTAPAGPLSQIGPGDGCTICGLDAAGEFVCDGPSWTPTPVGPAVAWDAFLGYFCLLRPDLTVDCYNWVLDGVSDSAVAPPGPGTCTDGVLQSACTGAFTPGAFCSEVEPCETEATGACCAGGICTDAVTGAACAALGGTFTEGGTCGVTVECPQDPPPVGACCDPVRGTCLDGVEAARCAAIGGTYTPGASCDEIAPCRASVGACCTAAACYDQVSVGLCESLNGLFTGGATCASGVACPDKLGACCIEETGECRNLETEEACRADGGRWEPGLDCGQCDCSPVSGPGPLPVADVRKGADGCSVTRDTAPSALWMALAGLALVVTRRRRRAADASL